MSEENSFVNTITGDELASLKDETYFSYFLDNGETEVAESEVFCDVVILPFVDIIDPVYFYSMRPVLFGDSSSGKDIVFDTPQGYHFLLYTYLRIKTPEIKVKEFLSDQYQIRWCDDMSIHTCVSSKLKIGSMILCSMDNYYMLFHQGYYSQENHSYSLNRDYGNSPDMINWSEYLPEKKLKPVQPWSYSRGFNWSFPLHRLNSQNQLFHVYTFNTDIKKLLRMRMRTKSGEWKYIPVDLNIIDIKAGKDHNSKYLLPRISMYGMLIETTKSAIEKSSKPSDDYMFEDIQVIDTKKEIKYGDTPDISYKTTGGLSVAVFWGAQNTKAELLNDYSNFTTNWADRVKGRNPIKKVDICHFGSPKLTNIDAEDFSGALSRKHFKSTPKFEGLHAFPYRYKMSSSHEMGSNTKKSTPNLVLRFRNPGNVSETESESTFKIRLRVQTIKYLSFHDDKYVIKPK